MSIFKCKIYISFSHFLSRFTSFIGFVPRARDLFRFPFLLCTYYAKTVCAIIKSHFNKWPQQALLLLLILLSLLKELEHLGSQFPENQAKLHANLRFQEHKLSHAIIIKQDWWDFHLLTPLSLFSVYIIWTIHSKVRFHADTYVVDTERHGAEKRVNSYWTCGLCPTLCKTLYILPHVSLNTHNPAKAASLYSFANDKIGVSTWKNKSNN